MIPIAVQAHAYGNQHLVRQLVHHSLIIWHVRIRECEDLIFTGLLRLVDTEMCPECSCTRESTREPDVSIDLGRDPRPPPFNVDILQSGPVVWLDRRTRGDK